LGDKFKNELVTLCTLHIPNVKLIYLFGSQASNQTFKNSDIDLAVLTANKIPLVERWELQQKLAEELNKDVDLVDLLSASTVLKNEIIIKGLCLFDPQNYKLKFEMQVMSMYQHLNDERSEIMNKFKRV